MKKQEKINFLLVSKEYWIRRTLFYFTVVVIIYIILDHFIQYYSTQNAAHIVQFYVRGDFSYWIWKMFEYLTIGYSIIAAVIITWISALKHQLKSKETYKILMKYLFLIIFIYFAYAIAAILSNIGLIILLGLKVKAGINLLPH